MFINKFHKRNEVLTQAATWMNIENTLNDRSPLQKNTYSIHINWPEKTNLETKKQVSGCLEWRVTANGQEGFFWGDRYFNIKLW
jgi:hypothetical protein